MKTLESYANALGVDSPTGAAALTIDDVSNSSRAKSGRWLFCAIPGAKRDGHSFVAEAIANGAIAVAISKDVPALPEGFPVLRVADPHSAWAVLCETRFDRPADAMTLCGVTGTNGKTTIAYLTKALLESCLPEARCGLVSTVVYDVRGADSPAEAARTTPDAYEFQSLLAKMRDNACTHVSMELSSHGLHQRRTGSAKFKTAVFTNLTGDHLDYHHDMESYFEAKKLLFTENLADDGVAIINVDDSYGARLKKDLSKSLGDARVLACSQSARKARCLIKSVKLKDSYTDVEMLLLEKPLKFRTNLIGEHNVYNLAEAACAVAALGVAPEELAERLSTPFSVPGRLEGFLLPSGAMAFVDYAHTDDALFRALSSLRPLCKGSLTTVFGCGGDRDAGKRPRMGTVAAKLSDFCVVTSDNPRSEDPLEIIAQIKKGIPHGSRVLEEPDRKKAIEAALERAVRGDVVLIAGKGHENYQETAGVRSHFDDRETLIDMGAVPRGL